MRHGSMHPIVLSGLLSALVLAGCGGDDGASPAVVTSIRITPGPLAFTGACQQQQLVAVALDEGGDPVDAPITWSSFNERIVTVSANGTVTSVGSGVTRVQALSGTVGESIEVTTPGDAARSGGFDGEFNIDLVFVNCGTPAQAAAVTAAAARWSLVITSDLSEFLPPQDSIECIGPRVVTEGIDDLRMYVSIASMDGPGGIVADSDVCLIRGEGFLPGERYLPIMGQMSLDADDLDQFEAAGLLEDLALHEMAHAMGVGRLNWILREVLGGLGGTDPHFSGARTVAAFDAAGGVDYTGGAKVPVEAVTDLPGNMHWREEVLGDELMTPVLNIGAGNPLSAITLQSLADIGYGVDLSGADAFDRIFTAPGRSDGAEAQGIRIEEAVSRNPIAVVDERGRIVRIINP